MSRLMNTLLVLGVVACTAQQSSPQKEAAMRPQSESFEIIIGKPHTAGSGLLITLHGRGHKHAAKGDSSLSRWELEITSEGKKESIDYAFTSGDVRWYMEGVAHGWLYTVEELFDLDDRRGALTAPEDLDKNNRRRVTLTPHNEPPLDPDLLWNKGKEIAAAEAKRRGCSGLLNTSARETNGTVSYEVSNDGNPLCRVLVGVYSGNIFFRDVDPPTKGKRKKRLSR